VRGLDGTVNDRHQVGPHRVQVDRVPEPGGEGGDGLVGVIADPVRAATSAPTTANAITTGIVANFWFQASPPVKAITTLEAASTTVRPSSAQASRA